MATKYGTLEDGRPDIAEKLDVEKTGKTAKEISLKSGLKAWWKCKEGHSFQRYVFVYIKLDDINSCPYCEKKSSRIKPGVNDFATKFPEKAKYYSKDNKLKPYELSLYSEKKYKWECNKGHFWTQSVYKYVDSSFMCPFCDDRRVWTGFNDLKTLYPEVSKEFDEEKNGMSASNILYKSTKNVWWKCKEGHSLKQSANSRTLYGYRCSYCSHKKLLSGFNDLATKRPDIAQEWHPVKNGDKKPTEFTSGSHVKVWWLCKNNHDYKSMITDRNFGYGCPYCSGNKVWVGFNDFATIYPDKAKEWHPTKNGNVKSTSITYGSLQKIWWLCKNNHEWEASPNERRINNCRRCSPAGTSKIEKDFVNFVKSIVEPFHKVEANDRIVLKPKELDIYISDLRIAFEFNGVYWHDKDLWEKDVKNGTSFSKEMLKTNLCNDLGIELFHVWEDDWDTNPDFVKSFIKDALSKAKIKMSVS